MRRGKRLFLAVCGVCLSVILVTVIRTRGSPALKSQRLLSADRSNWYLPLDPDQHCQYPQPNPWDESILRFVYDTPPIRCRVVQPDVAYIDDDNVLRINRSALSDAGYSPQYITCTYGELVRPLGKDDEISYGRQKPLDVDTGARMSVDMVSVKCKNWLGMSFYNDILISPRKLVRKAVRASVRRPLSVLSFGIDSMSRLNFVRQLPLTFEFLTKTMRSVVLHGMTRVGDNTYPNLMATLTGQRTDGGRLERPSAGVYFDDWPLVWRNFSGAGFATLLAEDVPDFSIFNYATSGFYRQPTDHYFRPFYIAIESDGTHRLSSNLCYGSRPKHVIHMEFLKRFLSDPAKRPYFAYSFLTELSHNLLNRIGTADADFRTFLSQLLVEGHLNDTVLLFFADHGHRFDEIRMTPIGRVEGSMPFFSVYLPPWLREEAPVADRNLRINAGRLTTMFDVHETFLDIFRHDTVGTGLGDPFDHVSPWGLSLFGEISGKRTCETAGVKDQFCICAAEQRLEADDERSVVAGKSVVDEVNSITRRAGTKCAVLELRKIHDSYRITEVGGEAKSVKVRVVLEMRPGGGIFEGIVLLAEGDRAKVSSDVSRINRYAGQDGCVTDAMKSDAIDLRKFCYCL